MMPALRIPAADLRSYLNRYNYEADSALAHLRPAAANQGHLTRNQLHELAFWKSKRPASLVHENDEVFVKEITAFVFRAKHEYSRIGALALLAGVQYPTASVILHFCVDDTYPILDYRAIWSLGLDQPTLYTPEYWVEYVVVCRSLAKQHGMSVREFDKALWQFSSENQPSR